MATPPAKECRVKPHGLAALRSTASQLIEAIHKESSRAGLSRDAGNTRSSRAIPAFLDKLLTWPAGVDELNRRSGLVAGLCGGGSPYESARERVIARPLGKPGDPAVERICDQLVRAPQNPALLSEIDRTAILLERWISHQPPPDFEAAIDGWLEACRAVQREADGLHVDGSWLLVQHLHELQQQPHDGMGLITTLTKNPIGKGNLSLIRSAVQLLIDGLDHPPARHSPPKQTRRRGRPKGAITDPQTDENLVNEWKKASGSGVAKKDFTNDNGITMRDLNRILDRVAKQAKRASTKS